MLHAIGMDPRSVSMRRISSETPQLAGPGFLDPAAPPGKQDSPPRAGGKAVTNPASSLSQGGTTFAKLRWLEEVERFPSVAQASRHSPL